MQVPFLNLQPVTQQIKGEYLKAVEKLLDGGSFILTQEVKDFEQAWATTIGSKFCLGISSGSDSLYLALRALDITAGDEVITQGNAYNASVASILRAGAVPKFVDIYPDSLTIDVLKIEPLINEKTKAIMPVHLYGQTGNMEALMAIAKKYNLRVIEDCAQAHLAQFKSKYAGTFGDIGIFSFYPTKNLGAFGDAGAVITDSPEIKARVEALRNLGETAKNHHEFLGFNMRLDPIQAIGLSLKLKYLGENTQARQKACDYYDKLIGQAGLTITPVKTLDQAVNVRHLYIVKVEGFNRDALREDLSKLGVQTAIHYPLPVYRQPFYQGPLGDCPNSDAAANQVLSLPLFVGITRRQQDYVVECLTKVISQK